MSSYSNNHRSTGHPGLLCPFGAARLATLGLMLAVTAPLQAQTSTVPLLSPPPPAGPPVLGTPGDLPVRTSPLPLMAAPPITINIDGRVVDSDPGPVLQQGVVYVPLRGVLESMGASVEFDPQERKIVILQQGRRVSMRLGEPNALLGTSIVPMAPPRVIEGRAFVPLRMLAELFGYRVAWLANVSTVAIYSVGETVVPTADHRAALAAAGPLGVGLDFRGVTLPEVPALLDAARASGAGMVKVNFEWEMFQPTKNAVFNWAYFDRVIKEARDRNLLVVGVLGGSTQWASVSSSTEERDWRRSPPKESEFPAWSNYVRRVVGRYSNDVHAWQIWQNPSASNFRSVPRSYRRISALAVEAARQSDPKAIIHAAEPGGVELDFILDLERNGLTQQIDGISAYPVSQWQPGALNAPEAFLLPYAALQEKVKLRDGRHRDYWVGGLSYPTLEVPSLKNAAPAPAAATAREGETPAKAPRPGLLEAFSVRSQAEYLVKSLAMSLATGSEKVFWTRLKDERNPYPIQPINPEAGTGLLRGDGSPRPAYDAFKNFSTLLRGKKYAGSLALDQGVVGLLFSDADSSLLVAWSPRGNGRLVLTSSGLNPQMQDATWVSTRPDSRVRDYLGALLPGQEGPDGVISLGTAPVFVSNVAYESVRVANANLGPGTPILAHPEPSYKNSESVKATFLEKGGEEGLSWRKYADFGGMARSLVQRGERTGLAAEAQRDIFDLLSARPFIYLDIADDFLYYSKGYPVTVTVEAYRPVPKTGGGLSPFAGTTGFHVEYDSPAGFKATPWQEVKPGEGWGTFTFEIADANFANGEGYDLLINANGIKSDLVFGSVTVTRKAPTGLNPVAVAVSPPARVLPPPPAPPTPPAPAPPTPPAPAPSIPTDAAGNGAG